MPRKPKLQPGTTEIESSDPATPKTALGSGASETDRPGRIVGIRCRGCEDPNNCECFVRLFVDSDDGTLPPIGLDNQIGRLADVAFESGIFGNLSPAILAIKMLAGVSLQMEPIQALFDLDVTADGRIVWKGTRDYETVKDNLIAAAGSAAAADFPDPVKRPAGSVVSIDFSQKPETPFFGVSRPSDASDEKQPLGQAQGQAADPGQESGEARAELNESKGDPEITPDPASGSSATPDLASPAETPAIGPRDDENKPDPATVAAGGINNLDEPANPDLWRIEIEDRLTELGFPAEKVNAKLADFDAKNETEQRIQITQCRALYRSKTTELKAKVFKALAADGKETEDQRFGFYTFCSVPLNSDDWTYKQAAFVLKTAGECGAAT